MIKTALSVAAYLVVLSGSAQANEVDILWACVSDQVAGFLSVPRSSEESVACVDDEIEASRQLRSIDAIVRVIHLRCARERQASDAAIFNGMPHAAEGKDIDQPLIDYVEAKLH